MNKVKKGLLSLSVVSSALMVSGCQDNTDVVSYNLTKTADNFEIMRRVVFYNTISDTVVMVTEGKCSVTAGTLRTSVICKVGSGEYLRNFYGKSDSTVYFVEQMETVPVNVYHYRRTFKPQALIPDIDLRADSNEAVKAVTPD